MLTLILTVLVFLAFGTYFTIGGIFANLFDICEPDYDVSDQFLAITFWPVILFAVLGFRLAEHIRTNTLSIMWFGNKNPRRPG